MKNYQKIIVLMLLVVSVCFSVILTASAAGTVDNLTFAVEASASAVKPGDEFTVTVSITKNDGFYFGTADLLYNSDVVEVVSIETPSTAFIAVKAIEATVSGSDAVAITIGTWENAQKALSEETIKNATLMTATDAVVVVKFKALATIDTDSVATLSLVATKAHIQGVSADGKRANYDYVINGSKDGSTPATDTVNVVAANHQHTMVVVEDECIPATCTEDGLTVSICSFCFEKQTAAVEKLGHEEVQHAGGAPTCTINGWNDYITCLRCDYSSYEETPAAGHTAEVIPAVPATWNQDGLTEGAKCSVCGQILTAQEVVPATGMPVWAIILIVIGGVVVAAGVVLLVMFATGKIGKKKN